MFEFLLSERQKMRRHAANWLEVAERVFHYRRDQLSDVQLQQLQTASGELKLGMKEKAEAAKLKLGIEKLEAVLAKTGGRQYPASSIVENVEFFLVAVIVILGLRAYFFQPFKIPTNSMWPTYYGMTHEVFEPGEEPGLLARAGRLVAFGATRYEVTAPADGEVYFGITPNLTPAVSLVSKRSFVFFPSSRLEYYFSVGGEVTKLDVPMDFNFNKVLNSAYGDDSPARYTPSPQRILRDSAGQPKYLPIAGGQNGRSKNVNIHWVSLGRTAKKGAPILSFDILSGDLLFVDRITYNFFPPKVGQGFVFKTENIHSPWMESPHHSGNQIRQYYIKRLVGTPGDTLEIKAPALWRNGQPITGAQAFDANAQRTGTYPGYSFDGNVAPDKKIAIPEHRYFAMGDNSPESADSRYWGFVPEKDVVGRPLFIYYPLTKRWGPAQ